MNIEDLETIRSTSWYSCCVKDIIGTIDMPTECGTAIRKGKSYSQNAEVVNLLNICRSYCYG